MFGIININKPKGFTSHDVVAKLRKILSIKQVGHTGTLDPLATGVLPVCVGKTTKVIQYLDDAKAYRASLKLGVKTDTYDSEGEVIETNNVELDIEKIKNYLCDFKGDIEQIPPMHSAVHYKGKRLYEYARKNIVIEDIPKRKVTISHIELVKVLKHDSDHPIAVIDVACSSGTYIRTIINDLGNKLGYGATMCDLIRTKAGNFKITDSYTIEMIQEMVENNTIADAFTDPADILNLNKHILDRNQLEKICHGQYLKIAQDGIYKDNEIIMLIFNNQLSAIAQVKDGVIYPKNVFA